MKFTIKYKTQGLSLVAGEVEADKVEYAKSKASELLSIRNIRHLDHAAIVTPDGTEAALLNVSRYNTQGRLVEWLTVHK